MKIITGHTGQNHITATDAQAFNQGIFGTGSYVLEGGQQFAASIVDATHVSIADGDGVMQGVHFRIERGQSETVTLDAGTLNMNRTDLVCARYQKDGTTGVESVSLAVIKGTEVSGTPVAPDYNTGDIVGGDTLVDFPLWSVTYTGLTPSNLIKLFTSISGLASVEATLAIKKSVNISYAGELTAIMTQSSEDYVVADVPRIPIAHGHQYMIIVRGTVINQYIIEGNTGKNLIDFVLYDTSGGSINPSYLCDDYAVADANDGATSRQDVSFVTCLAEGGDYFPSEITFGLKKGRQTLNTTLTCFMQVYVVDIY